MAGKCLAVQLAAVWRVYGSAACWGRGPASLHGKGLADMRGRVLVEQQLDRPEGQLGGPAGWKPGGMGLMGLWSRCLVGSSGESLAQQ
jgi:hypothetical protein